MRLNQIRDVVAIADRGSLRAAAQYLGLAQAALTRSIRELEHDLCITLFERHARGMRLTPIGESFVARMRAVQAELQRARDEVDQMRGRLTGQVSIGISMLASILLLPKIVENFKTQFPEVRLSIVEGLFPQLRGRILDGTLDLYVGPVIEDPTPSEFSIEVLFGDELVVLARKRHPLMDAASFAALSGASWVGLALADARSHDPSIFVGQYAIAAPKFGSEVSSALGALLVAANSDQLLLFPRLFLRHPGANELLAQIKIKERFEAPKVCLVTRPGLPLTPVAEVLSNLVRRAALRAT
jgi:LysR family transcriptional regulator, regulator of abg operon